MEHIDETALPAPEDRVVSATRHVDAPAGVVFELIADPSRQPEWDGNDNLAEAAPGQRVTAVGDVFVMTLQKGVDRANHVVEFEEGRRIAWKPSEVGGEPFGQLWRWEVEGDDEGTASLIKRSRLPITRSAKATFSSTVMRSSRR